GQRRGRQGGVPARLPGTARGRPGHPAGEEVMRQPTRETPSAEPATAETSGSLILGALRGWDRFWFTPSDPSTLAFIRIFAGLVIFYVHLTYSWGLVAYLGPEAWVDKDMADWVRRDAPIYALDSGWTDGLKKVSTGNFYWSVFFHVTDPGWIIAWHV